jgi:DNA-binding beta-propeller fold protein YncE
VDSWQLYSGPGATAPAVIPTHEWIRVRIEVSGSQARVFLGGASQPALTVPHLRHGRSRGQLGVMGPTDGTAFFSNFSYRSDDGLAFDPPPPVNEVPGIVRDWRISKPFPFERVDLEKPPEAQGLGDLAWTPLSSEPSGLVDVSRLFPRSGGPDAVFARSVIAAERDEVRKYDLGYSDAVTVFVNGQPVFAGSSQYQGRDSSFLGIVGWFDSVFLPLRKGSNEIALALAEVSGGWGFMLRDGNALWAADGVAKAWETPRALSVPESAAYDPVRDCVYVSNYDPTQPSAAEGRQAIARVGMDGQIQDPRSVTGLKNPTGLVVVGRRLFAVERRSIAEIDIETAGIAARYPIPDAKLPNDIAAAPDGALYVTDSLRATIFKWSAGVVEAWLQDERIARPNGIVVDGSRLVVGSNGDGALKSIDLATREIQSLVHLGPGIIDGVAARGGGRYLVSHNEGRLFEVTADGRATKILDTSVVGWPMADFALAGGMVIFPTFTDNRVVAFRLPAPAE